MYFTDSKGKTWTIDLDIPAAKRVRKMTGVDLIGRNIGKVGEALDHPADGVEILYWLCEPECRQDRITLDDWYDRTEIDLEPIAVDLCQEIRDFFHRRNQTRMMQAWDRMLALVAPETAKTPKTPGGSSTASPGSSESTQTLRG